MMARLHPLRTSARRHADAYAGGVTDPSEPDPTVATRSPVPAGARPAGLAEMRRRLRAGESSSRELLTECLARIDATRALGAFISVQAESALAAAEVADARYREARDPGELGPLHGLPTAHKDIVDVRGAATTHGSLAVAHPIAAADAPVVAAIRAAGAICVGKTQVPEFGIAAYSDNELAPPARHPVDPRRTAGGSSGGSASAVAAGVLPAAVGSDAGGSIRIPAAACGLIGLKPGRGAVPADRGGSARGVPGVPPFLVSGPIARTADDAALLFDALRGAAGEPSRDAVRRADGLRGLRIGVSLASPFEAWIPIRFAPEATAALDAAIATLEARAHVVEETAFRYDPRFPGAFSTVWSHGLTGVPFAPGGEDRLGALARFFLDQARATPAARLAEAADELRVFARDAAEQWAEFDAVLTPALAGPPPEIGACQADGPAADYRRQCEWAPQTSMVNVVGSPAVTAPTLRLDTGLSLGVQLIGRRGSEPLLLALAEQLGLSG